MSALTTFDLGDTGKIDLTQIYNQPDPRSYYQTLGQLDYRIPGKRLRSSGASSAPDGRSGSKGG